MKIFSSEEIRAIDKYTIEQEGISAKELVDRVGKGVADEILDRVGNRTSHRRFCRMGQ